MFLIREKWEIPVFSERSIMKSSPNWRETERKESDHETSGRYADIEVSDERELEDIDYKL